MNRPNSSLSQFIEEYPLYSAFGTDQPIEAADLNNLAFNFYCQNEKDVQPFRLELKGLNGASMGAISDTGHKLNTGLVDFTELFTGVCQSCLKYKMHFTIMGGSQDASPKYFIRKIGQYPAPESSVSRLPDEIAYFLTDESRELYLKAIMNLQLEQGVGALTYFKRLIGKEVERIVGALSDPYATQGNKIVEAFASYKQFRHKTKFIEDVTPLFPKSLQAHGANSLLMLHDVMSMAIDELTEAECIRKSKDIETLFRHLIKKIYAERNENLSEKPPGKYFLRYP